MIVGKPIAIFQTGAVFQQEIMADNLGLLLNPILSKSLAGFQLIIIAGEGVARERQKHALLMLPDMHHFVDEQRLDVPR